MRERAGFEDALVRRATRARVTATAAQHRCHRGVTPRAETRRFHARVLDAVGRLPFATNRYSCHAERTWRSVFGLKLRSARGPARRTKNDE